MSSQKDNKNPQITKLKDIEFFNLADKEFKKAVLRKLNKKERKNS